MIKDFATAIAIRGSSSTLTKSATCSLTLINSIISNTSTGIECKDHSSIIFKGSKICNSTHYGVIATSGNIKTNKLLLSNVHDTKYEQLNHITLSVLIKLIKLAGNMGFPLMEIASSQIVRPTILLFLIKTTCAC